MGIERFFHSVTLDKDACRGCINCVKRCPTEAIRVRDGKAKIITERCIDCGECIRICPHHAKNATSDPLSAVKAYEYTIALPAPALYAQFNNLEETDTVLSGLLALGFNEVFEVSRAAEIVSASTRLLMSEGSLLRPVISTACPAILRLVRVRFPELLGQLLPLHAPMEVAAKMARAQAMEKTGLEAHRIGVVFLSPCPAKVTAAKMPLGCQKSEVDLVVAIKEVYPELVSAMKQAKTQELASSGRLGMGWCASGGEAAATLGERYLAADGIENCIQVLEGLEDERFTELDFVELNACPGGCVGGVLNVENPYIAQAKLKKLCKYSPISRNHVEGPLPEEVHWDTPVEYEPVLQLCEDFGRSMEMLQEMQRISKRLYGVDCGSCGAPNCRALAEDIVRGFSSEKDCIFVTRDRLQGLVNNLRQMGIDLTAPLQAAEKEEV